MISINPELLAQLKVAGAGGVAPLTTSPLAVKAATTAPVAATASPLAVKTTGYGTPTPVSSASDPLAAIQQSLNGVVGYYQPQTAQEKAYADELAKYVGGLDAQYGSYGATRLTGDPFAQLPFGGPQLYKAPTAEQISAYYNKTPEQQTYYSFNLPSNKGNPTGQVNVNYNTPVALYDYRDGKLLYSGVGFDAAEKVAEMARNLSETQGRKAEWGIYTGAPGSTDPSTFKQVAYEKPNASVAGTIADIALPTVGALIAGPWGAAGGSALSSVAQGRSLSDTALRAAISGGLSYLGGELAGPQIQGVNSAALDKYMQPIVDSVQSGLQQSMVQGLSSLPSSALSGAASGAVGSAVGSAGGSALGGAGANLAGAAFDPFINTPLQTVTASWRPEAVIGNVFNKAVGEGVGAATSALTSLGANNISQQAPTNQQSQIDKEIAEQPGYSDIDVIYKNRLIKLGMDPAAVGAMTGAEAAQWLDHYSEMANPDAPKGSSWTDYLKYGSLGLAALDTLGGVLGGNKPSTGGGTGSLAVNPIFSVKLPTAGSGFGGGDGSFAVRPVSTYGGTGQGGGMTMDDWLSYGTRPERSFFSYVPENKATIAEPVTPGAGGGDEDTGGGRGSGPNDGGPRGGGGQGGPRGGPRGPRDRNEVEEEDVKEIKTPNAPRAPKAARAPKVRKGLIVEKAMGGYAAGGPRKSFAVEGHGTGRSDDIPAVLSDGEYVIDAETVALLGDGSSKAGAKKLDEFRINVRKHKGAKLAKGRFSANAKRPEKYLAGGKA